jgi:DNA topoisomerase-1
MAIIKINKLDNGEYKIAKTGEIINDESILEYIKKLVIPPAYRNVEILYPTNKCSENNLKILYSGIDVAGRPQFIYSKKWKDSTRNLKFCNVIKFGENITKIKTGIKTALSSTKYWTKERIIALILRIISICYFRIGNVKYEKLYSSHGISTIGTKHIKVKKGRIHFKFIGKKGVLNECVVIDPLTQDYIINLIKTHEGRGQKPANHLFQYIDLETNEWKHIKHTEINNWLKKIDSSFTSKLFRTYDTNILLIHRLKNGEGKNVKERKKTAINALKEVSAIVHNTPAICKKDYADPELIKLYLEHPKKFDGYFNAPDEDNGMYHTSFINWLKKTKRCD